ncbi:MAG: hypothetical protein CV087_17465 [Candidatus Brocadia sp. WS118]|nr:MAG: hypothetical protein CV087_17465 [Candidatus Brocadia sp. WS118]
MKPNQQEKCAHKKNLGESCSQCNEAWNDMTSPHQEAWAERFKKTKFARGGGLSFECSDYEGIYEDLLSFIRQELTSQHKADCERFREIIGKDEFVTSGGDEENAPQVDYSAQDRNVFRAELRTALSKMEEETP